MNVIFFLISFPESSFLVHMKATVFNTDFIYCNFAVLD